MENITLEDVKNILWIQVRKSLLHIHHYEYGTNVYDDEKLKESISRVDKDEEQLKERLKKDYKDTVDKIQQEIDKILITQNLQPNKKNVEYIVLMRRWIDLKLIRQNWKRDLLTDIGKCSHSKLIKMDDDQKFNTRFFYPSFLCSQSSTMGAES